MRIDIWSDVVCPWCYLGKRRLERAMGQLDWADEIEIHWRAYLLDPTATAEPKDLGAAIDKKYGPGAFKGMQARLIPLGEAEGITYRFDRALRVGTLDAHRLLAWAWAHGGEQAQSPLKERLLRAYFEDGENVADHATLASLAESVGLPRDEAIEVLAAGGFRAEVLADLEGALDREITGVPGFLIEDRLLIPGAQEPDTFVSVLTRARERLMQQG
ncbi:MAG: DsbA family oxidoreductase [Acidimicrobiales bacterium]|nr:DsbA family oxidoreductase [Acidimicrobiales bacterium]